MIDLDRAYFDKICRFHGWTPHPAQEEVLQAFFSGQRFIAAQFGRQSGKTDLEAHLVDYASDQPNKLTWCMAPTYQLTERLWNKTYPLISARHGKKLKIIRSSPPRMILPWNNIIEFKSGESPDSAIGAEIDFLPWDECAITKKGDSLFQMQLRACLAMRKGQVLATSTPRGHNWYYDMVNREEWWLKQYPSHCNPYLPPEELVAMRRELDPMRYRQEVLAEFVAFAGMVYSMFERERHVLDPQRVREQIKNWERWIAIDPGLSNPTAIIEIAHNTITNEDIVVRDHVASDMLFPDVLRMVKDWEPPGGFDGYVCDIAGHQRSQETGRSFVGWIKDNGDIRFKHGTKSIMDGVNCVRGRLLNMEGTARLWFSEDAKHTIKAMLNYHFSENKEEPVKDNIHDHAMDALRYFITYHYNRRKAHGRAA